MMWVSFPKHLTSALVVSLDETLGLSFDHDSRGLANYICRLQARTSFGTSLILRLPVIPQRWFLGPMLDSRGTAVCPWGPEP